jgi:NitT/TauT family transport system substrate-binding protein
MKAQEIVQSGGALTNGIGAMSAARIKDFYDNMVRPGLYKVGDVELGKVAQMRFVNRKIGLDRR